MSRKLAYGSPPKFGDVVTFHRADTAEQVEAHVIGLSQVVEHGVHLLIDEGGHVAIFFDVPRDTTAGGREFGHYYH